MFALSVNVIETRRVRLRETKPTSGRAPVLDRIQARQPFYPIKHLGMVTFVKDDSDP
jgi:hypothetical protein